MQRPDVTAAKDVVVRELQDEVDGHRAPDGHVVEDGPIVGVEGDLGGDHNDEYGGHDGPEDHVVGEVDAVGRYLVVVGACCAR